MGSNSIAISLEDPSLTPNITFAIGFTDKDFLADYDPFIVPLDLPTSGNINDSRKVNGRS